MSEQIIGSAQHEGDAFWQMRDGSRIRWVKLPGDYSPLKSCLNQTVQDHNNRMMHAWVMSLPPIGTKRKLLSRWQAFLNTSAWRWEHLRTTVALWIAPWLEER